jgi:hypothetical protein
MNTNAIVSIAPEMMAEVGHIPHGPLKREHQQQKQQHGAADPEPNHALELAVEHLRQCGCGT